MILCDILFPRNLPPLTYSVPEDLLTRLRPGQLVLAPLRGRPARGIVSRRYAMDERSFRGRLNEIEGIISPEPALSPEMLELLHWASDYYLTTQGMMLKSMLYREVAAPSRRVMRREPGTPGPWSPLPVEDRQVEEILSAVRHGGYRTFLCHAADHDGEAGLVLGIIEKTGSAVVLAPEVRDAELLYASLSLRLGEGVCIYHSEMKVSERTDSVQGMYSGRYRVVVGTRPVVFSPVRPSLIIVTGEHNTAYKQEESPRYHGRDVAVMRGYMEGIPVLLTSVSPSVESYHNCLSGKYRLMRQERRTAPTVSVIDLRRQRSAVPFLTSRVLDMLRSVVVAPGQPSAAMVVLQRRGYGMLRCGECGEMEHCPDCGTPLVVHRTEGLLCHLCGLKKALPDTCGRCGGVRLETFGSGTERIEEELKRRLGVPTVRLDSDTVRRRRSGAAGDGARPGARHIVVGTLKAGRMEPGRVGAVVFLNPDLLLNLPEIKAAERLMQEVFSLRRHLGPGGRLVLQTEIPWHPLYRYLRRWDYAGFVRNELAVRKKNEMPPYTNLVVLYVYSGSGKRGVTPEGLEETVRDACGMIDQPGRLIGPFRTVSRIKGCSACVQVILRDRNRQTLKGSARSLMGFLEEAGLLLRVDVDPVFF